MEEKKYKTDQEREQQEAASSRDLGTAGGGHIPGRGNARGGMSTTSSSTPEGRAASGAISGAGAANEHEGLTDNDLATNRPEGAAPTPNDPNTERTLGGRNPGEERTTLGGRDSKRDYGNQAGIDPMSSRLPDPTNEQNKRNT